MQSGFLRNTAALCLLAAAALAGCTTEPFTPKPRGYFRIQLPERGYKTFDAPGFPYSLDYPAYGRVVRDTLFFGRPAENPYWITIELPSLNGAIYLSYKTMNGPADLGRLLEDTHEMSFWHLKKADGINDTTFHNTHGVKGIFFTVTGDAASAYQFFATDSSRHFLRGALYFDVSPNTDSLRPANEFVREDLEHLIGTLRFR